MDCNQITEFDYKSVYNQRITIDCVLINKIIYVYFSQMTYLMNHITSLNNIYGWSYKLSYNKL